MQMVTTKMAFLSGSRREELKEALRRGTKGRERQAVVPGLCGFRYILDSLSVGSRESPE